MSRQSIEILTLTLVASGAVTAHRAALLSGAQAGANADAAGLARSDAASGEAFPLDVFGTAVAETGAAVALNDSLETDSLGRLVPAVNGPVVAKAMQAAGAAGQFIEVLLTASPAAVVNAAKLAQVLASNDVTVYSANGAVAVSGIALITGGTGLAGMTLAAPQSGALCRIRVASLSSGSVVVTTASGVTFDGTNNTATLDAAGEELVLGYKTATEWQVVENVGSVALSAV